MEERMEGGGGGGVGGNARMGLEVWRVLLLLLFVRESFVDPTRRARRVGGFVLFITNHNVSLLSNEIICLLNHLSLLDAST